MKDLLKKYRKIFAIFGLGIVLMVSYSLYYIVRYNLPQATRTVIMELMGPDVESQSMNFKEFGVVEVRNVTLKDKGKLILKTPKIEVKYSISGLLRGRINEIHLEKPEVWITREKNKSINIVQAFSKDSKKPSVSKAGTKVPIDIITVSQGKLFYSDRSYERPIEKHVEEMNGYVSFHKKDGIDLDFKGKNIKEKLEFLFNNREKKYSITIRLADVKVDDDIMQYAYDSKELTYLGGEIDLDLTLEPQSMTGSAELRDGSAGYKGLQGTAKDVSGQVAFAGDKVFLNSEFDLQGEKGQFFLTYMNGAGIDLDFYFKDINYKFLENYEMLQGLDLPVKETEFEKIHVNLNFNKDYDLAVKVDFKSPEYVYGNVKAKDIEGIFRYTGDKFYFENVKFQGEYDNAMLPLRGTVKLIAALDKKGGQLDYSVSKIEIDKIKNLKNIYGDINFNFEDKIIDFKVNSDIFSLKGKVDTDKKILSIKQESKDDLELEINGKRYQDQSTVSLRYDYGKKSLLSGEGKLDIKSDEERVYGSITALENNIQINSLTYNRGSEEATAKGNLDINDFSYKVNFASKCLNITSFLTIPELQIQGDFSGELEGKGKDLEGNIRAEKINGKYFTEFNNLEGDIYVKHYDGKLQTYFNGYLDKLSYLGTAFHDFRFSGSLENDILSIKDFSNNILTIYGGYNIIESNLDFQYRISELSKKKIPSLDIDFDAFKVEGSIRGSIDDIKADSFLKGVTVNLKSGKGIQLSGRVQYEKDTLSLKKFKMNQSLINGKYHLKDKNYNFKLNILEENLPEYYNDVNLKYRVMGELDVWGHGEDLRSFGMISLDEVYFRGKRLPDIFLKGSFIGDSFDKLGKNGKLAFSEISFLNDSREEIIKAKASLDLEKRYLKLENVQEEIDLAKIAYLFPRITPEGKLKLSLNLKGPLENIQYDFRLKGNSFKISEVELNNLDVSFNGDLKKIELDKWSIDYLDNNLNVSGDIELAPFNYNLKITSSEIDLNFLNPLLSPFGVEGIEGRSKIDLHLSGEKNNGQFYVENLRIKFPEHKINIQNVNSNIRLKNDLLFIEEFKGLVNDGTILLKGFLRIPDIEKINEEFDPLASLDYALSLEMDEVLYNYKDAMNLVLSSSAILKDNKVTGNFIVNRGEITSIPEFSKDDVKELQEIREKASVAQDQIIYTSKELGEDFAIAGKEGTGFQMDINLNIGEGLFVKLDEIVPLVGDLEAVIKGNGRFVLKNSRAQFLGQVELKRGEVTINNNVFEIERAAVVFNKENEYFPDVNPTILINVKSTISNEDVYIGISGELDKMEYTLSSASGLSQENITALLAFQSTLGSSETSTSGAVVKNVLDTQISKQIFTPISNEIQKILRISKFKISSDLGSYQVQEGDYQESTSLGFGALIEASNPLYKNKVFWSAMARITTDTQSEATGTTATNDAIDEYDFMIEYRFKENFLWGIGVGKLPQGRININEDDQSNLNYHLDFKFKKSYDNILDIFKRRK